MTRPMAMRQPGMFLSQPGMAMFASYHCPPITVSIESAITSLDCSENDMPAVTRAIVARDGIVCHGAVLTIGKDSVWQGTIMV